MKNILTGMSEATAICWWLASDQNMIWPEITTMSDEEFKSYDINGTGDTGEIILTYLVRVKGAKIYGWSKLSEEEKDRYRAYASAEPKRKIELSNRNRGSVKKKNQPGWYLRRVAVRSPRQGNYFKNVWCKSGNDTNFSTK